MAIRGVIWRRFQGNEVSVFAFHIPLRSCAIFGFKRQHRRRFVMAESILFGVMLGIRRCDV